MCGIHPLPLPFASASSSPLTPAALPTPPLSLLLQRLPPINMAGGRGTSDKGATERKRKSPCKTKPRAKNFSTGECVGATHWAAYRARCTGDMKRRAGGALLQAFLDATPSDDQPMARTRTVATVDKKIKNLHTRYIATCAAIKGTGMSTAHKENQIIKIGGAVLFDLAREAFKKSQV